MGAGLGRSWAVLSGWTFVLQGGPRLAPPCGIPLSEADAPGKNRTCARGLGNRARLGRFAGERRFQRHGCASARASRGPVERRVDGGTASTVTSPVEQTLIVSRPVRSVSLGPAASPSGDGSKPEWLEKPQWHVHGELRAEPKNSSPVLSAGGPSSRRRPGCLPSQCHRVAGTWRGEQRSDAEQRRDGETAAGGYQRGEWQRADPGVWAQTGQSIAMPYSRRCSQMGFRRRRT